MRLAYADPPYPGCADLYKDHPDYAGEVDHAALIRRLESDFDGFVLHTHVPALRDLLPMFTVPVRVCSWVKPFAAFKRNVPVAYAWEPVIVRAMRKPVVGGLVKPLRDFISEPITMKRGLTGAKPERVCWWAFEIAGSDSEDEVADLFHGTGAVTRAWDRWREACRNATKPLQMETT